MREGSSPGWSLDSHDVLADALDTRTQAKELAHEGAVEESGIHGRSRRGATVEAGRASGQSLTGFAFLPMEGVDAQIVRGTQ